VLGRDLGPYVRLEERCEVPHREPFDEEAHDPGQADEYAEHRRHREERGYYELWGNLPQEQGQTAKDVYVGGHYLPAAFGLGRYTMLGHAVADRPFPGTKKAGVLSPAGM
jgi:hypothetical protein